MTEDEMVGCITDSMDMCLGKLQELVYYREAWRACSSLLHWLFSSCGKEGLLSSCSA